MLDFESWVCNNADFMGIIIMKYRCITTSLLLTCLLSASFAKAIRVEFFVVHDSTKYHHCTTFPVGEKIDFSPSTSNIDFRKGAVSAFDYNYYEDGKSLIFCTSKDSGVEDFATNLLVEKSFFSYKSNFSIETLKNTSRDHKLHLCWTGQVSPNGMVANIYMQDYDCSTGLVDLI